MTSSPPLASPSSSPLINLPLPSLSYFSHLHTSETLIIIDACLFLITGICALYQALKLILPLYIPIPELSTDWFNTQVALNGVGAGVVGHNNSHKNNNNNINYLGQNIQRPPPQLSSARRVHLPPVSLTGGKTRSLFISLLAISNIARAASLVLVLFWADPSHHNHVPISSSSSASSINHISSSSSSSVDDFKDSDPREWLVYVLQALPALLLLSTYSVVVLFWAQVYYASAMISVPLLRPTFIFLNITVFSVFGVLAVVTKLIGAYVGFRTYSLCLLGLLHLLVAGTFVFYGIKVGSQVASHGKQSPTRNSIIRRVVFLSLSCPLLWGLRGIYILAFVFNVIRSYHPAFIERLTWDATIYFSTELVPSVLILGAFWSKKSGSPVNTPQVCVPLIDSRYLGQIEQSLIQESRELERHNNETSGYSAQDYYQLYNNKFGGDLPTSSGRIYDFPQQPPPHNINNHNNNYVINSMSGTPSLPTSTQSSDANLYIYPGRGDLGQTEHREGGMGHQIYRYV